MDIKSKLIRSKSFLVLSRKLLEPVLLSMGKKLTSGTFTENLKEIKDRTGIIPETIFDIGAATGKWSRSAHEVFPEAGIYAFEPVPESFKILQKNTKDIPRYKTIQPGSFKHRRLNGFLPH